jgi:tetratricopeptide (TPR) repeat protein
VPEAIPPNLRLVVSTLAGRALEELKKRGWPVVEVQPLAPAERKRLIGEYLAQYTKTLSESRIERIAAAPQSSNPLYVRALLEELRLFGVHERLDERIGHYLAAANVPKLYQKILARWEEDYERDRPRLVQEAMTAIWAARRGLSEAELLDLLGTGGEPLPRAWWSPLFLAAEQALVSRAGLIGFAHDYLRVAVRTRYLPVDEQRAGHVRLARYFEGQEVGRRQLDELLWQWAEARNWGRLGEWLCRPGFFQAAWRHDRFAVESYWARIERGSALRMTQAYAPVLAAPGQVADKDYLWWLAALLSAAGNTGEAYTLQTHLAEHYRGVGDLRSLEAAVGNQARTLHLWGRLEEALALGKEQERICRQLDSKSGLQAALGEQGVILWQLGKLDDAVPLLAQQEQLCREIGYSVGLRFALGHQALVSISRNRLEQAMELLHKCERLSREQGDQEGMLESLTNQAGVLRRQGRLAESMALLERAERICRDLGDRYGLSVALGGQAAVLNQWDRLPDAMERRREQERLCRELGNKSGLVASLRAQAAILTSWRRLEEALAVSREGERLCRETGDKEALAASLGCQALTLRLRGHPEDSLPLLREQESLARQCDDRSGLEKALGNQVLALRDLGRTEESMARAAEWERCCREPGLDPELLRICLGIQADILEDSGRPEESLARYQELERVEGKPGDPRLVVAALRSQARILGCQLGRPEAALVAARKGLELANRDHQTKAAAEIKETIALLEAGWASAWLKTAHRTRRVWRLLRSGLGKLRLR